MSLSQKLIDQLAIHEGVKRFAYKCPAGKWTIGVGRNIDQDGGIGLSDAEVYTLLRNDVARGDRELGDAFEWYSLLDQVRKDALCNLSFNLGMPRLMKFQKALGHLAADRYKESAEEFLDSLWATQVGQRALDVAHMVEFGEYPDGNGS